MLYNEDCIQTMRRMPDDLIDLVITSPPYNCGIDYDTHDDNLPWANYLDWCEVWLKEIRRVLKPDGRFCINVLLEISTERKSKRVSPAAEFYKLLERVNLRFHAQALWTDSHKTKYTAWGSWLSPSSPYIYCPYEVILIGFKTHWKKQNVERKQHYLDNKTFIEGCSGLWNIHTETSGLTKACFSIALPERCIRLLSYQGDLIYDPFMGSGTTAVAAILNNCRYVGSEISPAYYKISQARVQKYLAASYLSHSI
jgi:site-specific DNA-methyltransferase (adenine-specific)